MGEGRTVRVLLADAHSLFRQAVKASLEDQRDLRVVAEASDEEHAIAEARRSRPDVIFLDANVVGMDPSSAILRFRDSMPECRIVMLVDQDDPLLLAQAMEAGAAGYVSKSSALAELIDAAYTVSKGETAIPRRMIGQLISILLEQRNRHSEANRKISSLTRREREVLGLLADGADNETIARMLVISPETARTHLQNILQKLGVHSRLEAVAFVVQHGLQKDLVNS